MNGPEPAAHYELGHEEHSPWRTLLAAIVRVTWYSMKRR
jgi:hypothetical protein